MSAISKVPKPLLISGPIAEEIRRIYLAKQVLTSPTQTELSDTLTSVFKSLDVFYPIAEYLSPVEVINLTKVHKRLRNKQTNRWIIDRFRENLYELMIESGHRPLTIRLKELQTPWPFVISGSIALQALLAVKWDKFDIDIYVKANGVKTIQTLLRSTGYKNFYERGDTNDFYIQVQATQTLKSVKDWYNYVPDENEPPRSTVQVIELVGKVKTPGACVDSFDIDIVKNSWNGHTISVNNCSSILQRTAIVSPHIEEILGTMGSLTGSLVKPFTRLYALQGKRILTIDLNKWNLSYSDDIIVGIYTKIFIRFRKYVQRGFIIHCNGKKWGRRQIDNVIDRLFTERTSHQRLKLVHEVLKTTEESN